MSNGMFRLIAIYFVSQNVSDIAQRQNVSYSSGKVPYGPIAHTRSFNPMSKSHILGLALILKVFQ